MAPLDTAIQSVINSLDAGWFRKALRVFLVVAFLAILASVYALSQFRGLRDPEAMQYAQLARNIHEGRGFVTRCIRPADIAFLEMRGKQCRLDAFPDLRHAPLYPALLALAYRLSGASFDVPHDGTVFGPEARAVIPVGAICYALTGLVVYLLGRRLFGRRQGAVAALVYYLGHAVLSQAVSGLHYPLVSLLVAASLYALVAAASAANEGRRTLCWLPGIVLAGLLGAAAFLAGYGAVVMLPALVLLALYGLDEHPRLAVSVVLLVFCGVVAPWIMRNVRETGLPLGDSLHAVFLESGLYAGDVMEQGLGRLDGMRAARLVRRGMLASLPHVLDIDLRSLGSGLIACFFLVSFFQAIEDRVASLLRWCLLPGIVLMVVAVAAGWLPRAALGVLLPLVAVYGTAGFFQVIGEEASAQTVRATVSTWVLVALSAFGTAMTLLGPRARIPYPPYYPPFAAFACDIVGTDSAICTDIPEATAWYGDKVSLLLPRDPADLTGLQDRGVRLGGVYLTTRTGDKPYTSGLVAGTHRAWLPILQGEVPAEFPFKEGVALPPGTREQLLLTENVPAISPAPPSSEPPVPTPATADRP